MNSFRPFILALTLVGSGTAIAAPSPPDASRQESTRLEHALTFSTIGCGGAVLQTPQPGTQFAADEADLAAPARAFYALAAAHNVTWLSSMECEHTGRTHVLVPATDRSKDGSGDAPNLSNASISANWSGYQFGHTARYVQAAYVVPTVSNPAPPYSTTGYYASAWAGIGGGFGASSTDPLIQAGTAMQINGTVKTYYHWYEVVHGPSDTHGEIRINSIVAHAGDSVATVSAWISTTNQATMGICNLSTGVCAQFFVANTPAPGASTEWIVEAPSSGTHILPLAKFGSVSFNSICWSSAYVPGSAISCGSMASPTAIKLQQNVLGGYQILADPGVMAANGNFTDYYEQPTQVPTCGTPGHPPCP
jgi:hypothetical protein